MAPVNVSISCTKSEFMFRIVFWNCFRLFRNIRDVDIMGTNFLLLIVDMCGFALDEDVEVLVILFFTDGVGCTRNSEGIVSTRFLYENRELTWVVAVVVTVVCCRYVS